ncbi:acetyltransferase [Pedobacter sp. Du54]|uniref:acetyltransferase n=1 Tax=Pedobacter anseongensis TaxID=3133439 RepID=UPI00309C5A6D
MHIIGANGHAKVILDILAITNTEISGIWDDNSSIEFLNNFPVNGNIAEFKLLNSNQFIVAIGNNTIRRTIAQNLMQTKQLAKHTSSAIAKSVILGGGTVLMANTSINANVTIGEHVIINTNASVDHDCKIANFVHISPQVGLAGNVEVGEGAHIGIGAIVIQGIKIGKWATIGAGAVIIKNVPDYAVVVGNPGKIIKYNQA